MDSVPSHFLIVVVWRSTKELILSRNLFLVISVPSHIVAVAVWRLPLPCNQCPKSLGSGFLKRHIRTHSGEKHFSCDQGSKSFNQRGHLKIHRKTHTGEKYFLCNQCHSSFLTEEIWRSTKEPILVRNLCLVISV